ncbi:putative lipoprotein [Candidatus Accumulibacter aalborgensis]|uniref:Putative lipoprotein n=1 Tax=Candidatus Accumulibacter aalborgensis TaxID=1860102 RepID=A0A1A8XZA5_9PROT|nr:ABC-type transport auxiliary lipoprotein family protein [Candidatus Accumulibacter aalborgensis]SBT10007.1 putative lipoprotein [Candidatus Accumulibacter aalborgensis]
MTSTLKTFLICLAACFAAGCAGNLRKSPPAEVYDFGLPVQRVAESGRWSNVALEVKASYWLDSSGIDYRLLYESSLKLRSYATSRWAGAPALLLSQRLRQQLGLVSAGVQTACLLRFELHEFSQLFDTPQHSRGILQGSASVFASGHRLVAERQFAIEQPAPSADARGGVSALVSASEQLGQQLTVWLRDLEKRGTLESCRSTVAESQ